MTAHNLAQHWQYTYRLLAMEDQIEKVKKYYDAVQKSYDEKWMNKENLAMHLGFWDKTTKNLHEALINENKHVADSLAIEKEDIVLDAGCGVGGTAIWIAENYDAKVAGVNIVKKQIESAKKYAEERNVAHLASFKMTDFASTGFPSEFFTKAFAIESICHSPQKENVLKEIYRVLKPNGKFVFIDAFLEKQNLNEREKSWVKDWCKGWACPDIPVLKDFLNSFKQAGFKIIKDTEVTEKSLPCSKILFDHCKRHYRLKSILAKFKMISGENYWNTRASISQHLLYKNQVISHHLLVVQK